MGKEITEASQLRHGMRVTCHIEDEYIDDAKISIHGEKVWICQNVKCGDNAFDKLEYSYSWTIGNVLSGSPEHKDFLEFIAGHGRDVSHLRSLEDISSTESLSLKESKKIKV